MAFLIAGLMFAASISAVAARPSMKAKAAVLEPAFSLEAMIPKRFGDWREEPQRSVQVINPQRQEQLDSLYSEILSRTYVNAGGYSIMLSLAYGGDQRGALRAHMPESCYQGQGFTLHKTEQGQLATPFGEIPVRRMFTSLGPRQEPVTYWISAGDKVVPTWQSRLVELSYTFTGRVPDGILFRVSSIDADQARANRMQDQFVNQLLQAVSPAERTRLSGLGGS
jgi:EpsI family protein